MGGPQSPRPEPAPVEPAPSPLRLRSVRAVSGRYRGEATGRVYAFTAAAPVQTVHPADAPTLLRTGLFAPE
jgi:hypothetical protein